MNTKINGQKYEYTVSKYNNYKGKMVNLKLQMEKESPHSGETYQITY